MSAISAQRLIGPLAFYDIIYQHVYRMLKESAYKRLVRPVLEYGSSVWDPSGIPPQEEIEKVQKRLANRQLHLLNWEYDWHSNF